MNPVDRLLRDEMNQLLDRIAATVPEGSLPAATARDPTLPARLDETEARLPPPRPTLLETEDRAARAVDLGASLGRVASRGRRVAPASRLDEPLEAGGADGALEPLEEHRLDPRAEPAGVAGVTAKRRAERAAHASSNRSRPLRNATGASAHAGAKRFGPQTLSSSSTRSWSVITGENGTD